MNRDDKQELDVRILAKNLEITKLTTSNDRLKSELLDLQIRFDELLNSHSIKIIKDE